LSFAANAQYDLTITYNANSGVSNLLTATKIYMHSGASDVAGPLDTTCWNYTVGNWGVDDGIGEMFNLSGSTWSITIDPVPYYSTAPNGPVTGPEIQRIGIIFRDETGTLTGLDDAGNTIYLDLSSGSPIPLNSDGSPFFGVTAGMTAGISSLSGDKVKISNFPNPLSSNTVFSYDLAGNSKVKLSIFDASGRLVNTLFNELQSNGTHHYNWIGDDANGNLLSGGIYYYSLTSNIENVNGKLIIVR
jgi:hypothetical protein